MAEQIEPAAATAALPDLTTHRSHAWKERAIAGLLWLCATVSALVTAGIVVTLVGESIAFFRLVSPVAFFTGTEWSPLFRDPLFGVLPLLSGSLLVAGGAALIAIPVGLLSAIYLSEYASPRLRSVLKPLLEVLAGIPTVVYGYFALTFVTPLLQTVFPSAEVFNAASAALVVGVMIIPTVSSLSDDALRAVPLSLRAAAYGLGATKLEVSTRVVVPAALSGVIASFMLAVSRAIGETMAVAIAAGNMPNLTLNGLESIQTMTAYIVQASLGDTPRGTMPYRTLFAVGTTLFAITLVMNIASQWVLARFREEYR